MASLAEALFALPTPRLRALVELRKVPTKPLALIPNKRQLVQLLANEFNKAHSISEALQYCNLQDLRLLQLIITHEPNGTILRKKLLKAMGDEALSDSLNQIMTRLEDIGLAFRVAEGVFLPSQVTSQIPISLADRYRLERCLNAYDAPTTRKVYERLGLSPNEGSKLGNINAILDHLLLNGPTLALKDPLTLDEKTVLDYMVQAGGSSLPTEVAGAVLGKEQAGDFFRYDWQNRWKAGRERNAIDHLLARGILHVVSHSYGYNLYLVIPGDLLRVLRGNTETAFWATPIPTPQPTPNPPPATGRHLGILRDVVALLSYVGTQETLRTNTGHIHRTSLKNIMRTLSLPTERYGGFVYALCREANLIAVTGERAVYGVTPQGTAWLQESVLKQTETLFQAWQQGGLWGEMYLEPLGKASDYRAIETMRKMRQAVLGAITESQPNTFTEMNSLTDALAFRAPLLLAQSHMMGYNLVPAPAIFVRKVVEECLYWLGMVEVGLPNPLSRGSSADSSLATTAKTTSTKKTVKATENEVEPTLDAIAYQLTSLGQVLLGTAPVEGLQAEPREDKFIVQANAEVFLSPYLDPYLLYRLLTLTDIPSKGAVGNTVTITRESLRRALDKGQTSRDILSFMQDHARTGVPQNVEYLINEIAGKHGHIRVGKAQMYIQVDSALLLKELQARRELKNYTFHNLSDTIALIQADDLEKLVRELRKAGYMPISDVPAVVVTPAQTSAYKYLPVQPTPPPSRSVASSASQKEATIDWDRLAKEDTEAWNKSVIAKPAATQPGIAQPAGKTTPTNLIKSTKEEVQNYGGLFRQAIILRQKVEILYQHSNGETETDILEPRIVAGNFVNAFSSQHQKLEIFNTNLMRSVRLLNETFSR